MADQEPTLNLFKITLIKLDYLIQIQTSDAELADGK